MDFWSPQRLLKPDQRRFRNNQPVVAEHIVGLKFMVPPQRASTKVARRKLQVPIGRVAYNQDRFLDSQFLQSAAERFCLRLSQFVTINYRQLVLLKLCSQGRAQSAADHLSRKLNAVIARLRTVSNGTMTPQ